MAEMGRLPTAGEVVLEVVWDVKHLLLGEAAEE